MWPFGLTLSICSALAPVAVRAARIRRETDAFIVGVVNGWPRNFEAKRAAKLGFTTVEKTFDDIIRIHIEDELGGKFVA